MPSYTCAMSARDVIEALLNPCELLSLVRTALTQRPRTALNFTPQCAETPMSGSYAMLA